LATRNKHFNQSRLISHTKFCDTKRSWTDFALGKTSQG